MRKLHLISATALTMSLAMPAYAQDAQADEDSGFKNEIVVTAQRQAQSLQEVPIAVSAFSAETLEKQQIENSSDLQLTLPNVTFTKSNFTGSSFTIRGIGDLCVGTSCDAATAIHMNGSPILGTRLFETEFFDLEQIEVLRGPQGTLFGRNATSGVVNIIAAKPDFNGFKASADFEYGNFNSMKAKGMVNLPLSDTLGVRVGGFYLKRDGYTENLYDGSKIDDRDMYAVRGSLRWEPSDTTRVDLMAYYFREKDNRMRIQKQVCQRDPSGVLGCLPNRRDFGATNANSTFVGVLSSRELLAINTAAGGPAFQGLFAGLGLGSLYGPDAYATFINPADVRQVRTDFTPEYFASEQQYQARLEQDFGPMKLQLTGMYLKSKVDSRQDYNLSVQNGALYATAIANLTAASNSANPLSPYFAPILAAVRSGTNFCTSDTEATGTGSYQGHRFCSATPQDYDRSNTNGENWSVEGLLSSDFDGAFNFLLGGIYLDGKTRDTDYYVNSFGIDWVTGVLGAATGIGGGLPPGYLGTPYYRNRSPSFNLKSYGLFGEGYLNIGDKMKLTVGLRYNHDEKDISAHTTLASFYVPFSATNAYTTAFGAGFDADPKTVCAAPGSARPGALGSAAGCEVFQNRDVSFSEWTGRAVLDYKVTDDNLLYASYSRGYKSGGINPPLSPVFAVADSFEPEFINAFEIGSKNSFAGGAFTFNATAFYYQYKALQLSRIVARTSVNDNVDANIYGLELESIIRPDDRLAINIGASYLHTKVSQDKFLGNPRDPSGGRADAVIIKDITNGANCAVVPTTAGNATGTNTLVGAINGSIGLRAPAPFAPDSGLGATGAFGICSAIAGAIAAPSAGLRALFGVPTGALPFAVENAGVPVNIKGNRLPQAPNYKWNVGIQHSTEFSNGMTIVPRLDVIYVGDSFGNIFNGRVNKIKGYSQINAQVQLNGADDKWFVRGFVQNVTDSNATTGLYVTDQSSGLFTNIFTLDPRRYGIAAGFKF